MERVQSLIVRRLDSDADLGASASKEAASVSEEVGAEGRDTEAEADDDVDSGGRSWTDEYDGVRELLVHTEPTEDIVELICGYRPPSERAHIRLSSAKSMLPKSASHGKPSALVLRSTSAPRIWSISWSHVRKMSSVCASAVFERISAA